MPLLQMLQVLSRTPVRQNPQLRAVLAVTCGRWCAVRNENEEATQLLNHALELVGDLRPAMRLLYRIYLRLGDIRNAVKYLDQEIRATRHPREAAALYRERGKLVELHFGDRAAAMQCYRAALKATPKDLAVLRSVETVALLQGDYHELISNLEAQLDVLHDPQAVAGVLHDLSLLEARHSGDLLLAGDMLLNALAAAPNHRVLAEDLGRLSANTQDPDLQLRAYEHDAEARKAGERATPLSRASRVLREARELPAAVTLLHAAALDQPENLSLWRSLEELSMSSARYDMAVEACVGQLKQLGNRDRHVRAELFYRLGKLAMIRLDRVTEGLAAMRKALHLNPEHIPALEDTSRYLVANQSWSQLLELLKLQATAASESALSGEQQALSLLLAGQVLEQHLDEPDGARDLYQQALKVCPTFRPAFDRLERLLHRLGRHAELRSLYQGELKSAKGPRKIFVLAQLGQLYAQSTESDQAIKVLASLLKEQPDDLATIQSLAKLLARSGRKKDLLKLTEREVSLTKSNQRKTKLLHRAAELALEEGGRPQAIGFLEQVLEIIPDHSPSLLLLERCLRDDNDKPRLLELLHTRLSQARDSETRISLRLSLATMLRLDAPEKALSTLDELLREHPRNLPALHMSEQLAAELNLPKLLATRIEQHASALRSPHSRALHLYRAAQVQRRQQGDSESAIKNLERALELSPQLGVCRAMLLDLCQQNGNHEQFMRAAREALVWERGPTDRRAIALQLAERTADSHPALRYLIAAATARPGNLVTQRRIVRIARLLARHADNQTALRSIADELLRSGRKTIGRKLMRKQYPPEVLAMHYLAAQAAEASGDAHGAATAYEALVGPSPVGVLARRGHGRALALRAPTAREKAISDTLTKAEQLEGPQRAAALTRAAELLAAHGADDAALKHLQQALQASVNYLPAYHTRARILSRRSDPKSTTETIATLRTLAGLLHTPEHRVEVLCRGGRLALHTADLPDAGKLAWSLFAEALEQSPTSRLAFHGLWQTCARFGGKDAPTLSRQLLRRVESLDNASRLNSRALRAIARVGHESDGAACAAEILEHGQAIARKNPIPEVARAVSGDPGLYVDLARLYAELKRWPEAVAQLELALEYEPSRERQATLHYLVADALARTGKPELSISHYIRASAGGYHPRQSLRIADTIAAKLGNAALRKKVLEPLLKIGTREDRANGLRALADLESKKPVRAVAVLRTYLKIRPRDTDAICELAGHLRTIERPEDALAVLKFGVAVHRMELRDRGLRGPTPAAASVLDVRSIHSLVRLFSALGHLDGHYLATAALEVAAPELVPAGEGCDELMPESWGLPQVTGDQAITLPLSDLPCPLGYRLLHDGLQGASTLPGAPPPPLKLSSRRQLPRTSNTGRVTAALAALLGVPAPAIYLNPRNDHEVIAFLSEEPALLIGRKLNAKPFTAATRDAIGRALVRLQCGGDHLARLSDAQLLGVVAGIVGSLGLEVGDTHRVDSRMAEQMLTMLSESAIAVDLGEDIEPIEAALPTLDPAALRLSLEALEDRIGVLCSGDPRITLAGLKQSGHLTSTRAQLLLRYLVGDEHLSVRRSLGYHIAEELDLSDVVEVTT